MSISTVVILAVIIVLCVFSARSMYRSFTGKGGCHGGGGAKAKRVRVADTNEANYRCVQDVRIGGMTCANCATNVENALNGIDGAWARVDLGSGTAHILSKRPLEAGEIEQAVANAGYYVSARCA